MATKKDSDEMYRLNAEIMRLTNLLQVRTAERDEIKAQRDEIRKLYNENLANADGRTQQIRLLETKLAAVAAVVAAVNAPTAPLNLWGDRSGLAQRLPSPFVSPR